MTDPLHKIERRVQKVLDLFGLKLTQPEVDESDDMYYHVFSPAGFCIGLHVYLDSFLDDIVRGDGETAFTNLAFHVQQKLEEAQKNNDYYLCNVRGAECEVFFP